MSVVYYGTKCVEASPADRNGEPGYAVRYEDGYESWSPKRVFEQAYHPTNALSFGHATIAARSHQKKVTRREWNNKDIFVYFVPQNAYPAQTEVAKKHWGEDSLVPYRDYLAQKLADGTVIPFQPSQADIFTRDWMIVE